MQDVNPGLSLLEIGARRYARENELFSYQNCVLAEEDGRVVGMLHGFVLPGEPLHEGTPLPERDLSHTPEVLRPYEYLEWPGSYYVSGVAVRAEMRNRGIGRRFLQIAEGLARERGCALQSLVVFEQNEGAHRLYLREGWHEVARCPVVPHPMIHCTGDAILMLKRVP